MNKIFRNAFVALAATSTIVVTAGVADAGNRDYEWRRMHHGRHFHNRAVAAGVLGLAAGVVIGEALSRPRVVYEEPPYPRRSRVVVEEAPLYEEPGAYYEDPDIGYADPDDGYAEPDRAYDDRAMGEDEFPARPERAEQTRQKTAARKLEPWTAEWRSYCKDRFQSFNATTGTYTGYDGRQHFCTAG